jgi:hypothetical protein
MLAASLCSCSSTKPISKTGTSIASAPVEEEEEMILQAPAESSEEMLEEESMLLEAAPVDANGSTLLEPVQDVSEMDYVRIDLRKEFPKRDLIALAQRKGVTIEDIYFYHNATILHAIHVKTSRVETQEGLRSIQTTLNDVFSGFGYAFSNTYFRSEGACYAVSASKKQYGNEEGTVFYDYKELMGACSTMIDSIQSMESYPFKGKELYGIFITPGDLSFSTKSNFNDLFLHFVVKEENGIYKKYLATKKGVYAKDPIMWNTDEEGRLQNYGHNKVIIVDQRGDLLTHSNEIPFDEKYSEYYIRVE